MSDETALERIPENVEAMQRVRASTTLGDPIKRALQRIADGETYRAASKAEGYADGGPALYRAAVAYGVVSLNSARQIGRAHRIADLSGSELEHRLLEKPEDFSDRDLSVARGIEIDKIAKRERWEKPLERDDYLSAFDALAGRIGAEGGKVTLTVEVEPAQPAIDVTPKP